MPRILQADVDEVKARTNIADIIGERVALRSAGVGSLKGLCPFHDEKSPSFHVRQQVGYYHCFGCGESGDVYSFLREMDHVSFTEAVERLAGRIGYTLHYEDGGAAPETSGRSRLYAANTAAAEFFRAQLLTPDAEAGRRFLGERGFDAGAAAHFGVGFAPRGWDGMLKALTAQGFTREELSNAGLVSTGQRGVYDRFRGRLVWPIRDVSGQTIGFGARKLFDDDQGPKYLNTPETPIYKKAQVLYGLDLAKRDIARGDPRRVVVVEGYTDVMACHLAGLTTAIATCGTAFGTEHIKVLRRVMGDDNASGEVVFTFDGDEAGQKAALRAFTEDDRFNAQTFVAVAPDGMDPCDLRLQRGDAAVRGLMDAKQPMFEFAIDRKLGGFDLSTVEGRVGALRAAAPIVAEIRDQLLRPGYERVLARRLGMDPTEVRSEVERAARGASTPQQVRREAPLTDAVTGAPVVAPVTLSSLPRSPDVAVERDALMGALQYGHQVDQALLNRALEAPFRTPGLDAVREAVAAAPDRTRAGWVTEAVNSVREPYRSLAGELLMTPFPARDEERAVATVADLTRRLVLRQLEREKQELLGAVQRVPADSDGGRALRMRLRDIDAERQRFAES
ncbi:MULTISPECIES: DNA primase [Microbacterium]|jgi:DNA primase|uniref:DNA primase n=2 Tax=Microbacterium maritypicum TaxID=33918 RepID=A0A4Y4B2Q8_MICMQ|nr:MULTISPECIES: DNA primase [Microbacterium]AZS46988.1 DNA primase [Microbacterium oxydans]KAB1887585.1 DNA primase [Microbacterium liquefaciens]KQV03641.1 DNA primase [Microbacterium sp. Root322]KQY76058.1 DNA primase [Microbacterium sp. Root1433D1]WKT88502.1 DNA primase [Microbacterium liquefaciens]